MAVIDELVVLLGFQVEGKKDVEAFQRELDKTAKKMEAFAGRATTAVANFGDKIFASMRRATIVAGTLGAGIGVAFGKGIIDASAEWEGFTAALTTLEGSSEAAEKSLDWIADFAKKTPYQLAETVRAFTKLKAYGIDPTQGSLRTLGDAASAMNKPLDAAVEMFADAASFQFERLREFGITAKQEGENVTFQFQKDGKTVQETVKKTGEAVTSWVKNNLEGRFGGAMLRQSKTFGGMMSNLVDYWEDFQRRIGRGGFFDTVKNRLADFLDYLDVLDKDGTLDRWSRGLSWGFTKAADGVAYLAKQLKADIETLAKLWSDGGWSEKIQPFLVVLALLFAAMFPVTTLFAGAALALNDWLAYMQGADSVIGAFIDAIAEFLGVEPERVATVLGDIAEGAAWFAAAAIGVSLFASSLRSLSKALILLKGAQWAVKLLAAMAGIRWGVAAAGAAGAAAAAGGVAAGGTAAGGAAAGTAAAATGTVAAAVGTFMRGLIGRIGVLAATPGSPWSGVQLQPFTDEQRELLRKRHEERSANPRNDNQGWSGGGFDDGRSGDGFMSSIRDSINGIVDNASSKIEAAFKDTQAKAGQGALADAMPAFLAKMQTINGGASEAAKVNATITDARQDNRQFPVTVNSTVNQTVQQASQAPAAAARATSAAIGQAAVQSRPQVAQSATP